MTLTRRSFFGSLVALVAAPWAVFRASRETSVKLWAEQLKRDTLSPYPITEFLGKGPDSILQVQPGKLYLFPTDKDAAEFSAARFEPFL
jgi:hypothetical protein